MNKIDPIPIAEKDAAVVDVCRQILAASLEDRTLSLDLRVSIQNIQVRLKIWAGNVGVFGSDTASLGYRLRDDPDLVELLLSILRKLKDNLDKAAYPPLLEETEDESESHQERHSGSVASSSSSALLSLDSGAEGSSSGDDSPAPKTATVFIKEANDMVNRLYRLASVFRKPVSSSENAKVLALIKKLKERGEDDELKDVDDHARTHIKAHFPQTPKALVDRLVDSVLLRRMKIRYRQRHQRKLNQGLDLALADQTLGKDHSKVTDPKAIWTSGSSSRIEGDLQAKDKSTAHFVLPRVAVSATNASSIDRQRVVAGGYARSTALSKITQAAMSRRQHLDVPPPPRPLNAGQKQLECPYCRRLLQLEEFEEPRWTRHILKDIDPYVCLFEDCIESHTLFKTAEEWLGHMQWQHNVVYACQAVGHENVVFAHANDLESHLRKDHPGAFTESQLLSLVNQSALPGTDTFSNLNTSYSVAESSCLLCNNFDSSNGDNEVANTDSEQKMQNHILEHLEALALLAIPGDDDLDEVQSNVRQSSRNARASLETDSDNSFLTSLEDTGARAPDDDLVPDCNVYNDHWVAALTNIRHAKFPEPDKDPVHIYMQAKHNKRDLEFQIRDSLLPPSDHEKFLPVDELHKIITFDTVYAELFRVLGHVKCQDDLKSISYNICDETKFPKSPSTSRKKLFATLVCINKAACISDFIHENIYDCHLPFYFTNSHQQDAYVYRKAKNGDEARVQCFETMSWSILDCENFQKYQWGFLAPYLEIISNGKRKRPRHYDFDDGQVLPFVEDSRKQSSEEPSMFSGGYSDVWRVRIHPAHHSHPSVRSMMPVLFHALHRPNQKEANIC